MDVLSARELDAQQRMGPVFNYATCCVGWCLFADVAQGCFPPYINSIISFLSFVHLSVDIEKNRWIGAIRTAVFGLKHILPPVRSYRGRIVVYPKPGPSFRCTTPEQLPCNGCFLSHSPSPNNEINQDTWQPSAQPVVLPQIEFISVTTGPHSACSLSVSERGNSCISLATLIDREVIVFV